MKFAWHPQKELLNAQKHSVDFSTAPRVFADSKRILQVNKGKSPLEPRYRCIGFDGRGILTVCFTLRRGVIRLISAGYWRKGKKIYEAQH
jgi:uncharacterized protein